jgi:hypothetical protein
MSSFVSEFYGFRKPKFIYDVAPNQAKTPRITHPDLEFGKFVVIHCLENNLKTVVLEYDIPVDYFDDEHKAEFEDFVATNQPAIYEVPDTDQHVPLLWVPDKGMLGLVVQHFIEIPDPRPEPQIVIPISSLN